MLSDEIPQRLICAITNQIMSDPVVAADGYTYEREAIKKWLSAHHTSPKTGEVLKHKELTENRDKKGDVSDFLKKHPEAYEDLYVPVCLKINFLKAIQECQIEEIDRLLSQDPQLLMLPLENDYTALHLAASQGNLAVLNALLKRQDVILDLKTSQGETSLHLAAKEEKDVVIPVLLEAGANRKSKNTHNQTPMALAILAQHPESALLIENTASFLKQSRLTENKRLKILVQKQIEKLEIQGQLIEMLRLQQLEFEQSLPQKILSFG